MTTPSTGGAQRFVADFESFAGADSRVSPASGWLRDLRRAAIGLFAGAGLPSTKLEGWRYTNVKALGERPFAPVDPDRERPPVERLRVALRGAELNAIEAGVVDGTFAPELRAGPSLPEGVVLCGFADCLEDPDVVEHLGRLPHDDEEPFAALNTAFLRDGVVLRVGRGVRVEAPIHLRFVATGAAGTIAHPRALVVLEENSEATVIESFASVAGSTGDDPAPYVTNVVTQLVVGPAARLRHVRLQDEARGAYHLATFDVHLGRDAGLRSHTVSLGAALARTATRVQLAEAGASCVLVSLGVVGRKQHLDGQFMVEHAAPHCTSNQRVKNVLDDDGRTVFNARVLVREGAQKTDANQQNKNLVLSKRAVANTRPQLEIYADDVKCAHGATVGQLDEDQLFYLRSRGLDAAQARRELTYAFAREIVDELEPEAAREAIGELVRARFGSPEDRR
jgi:Fe-S cluster assembly protein SufD